MNKKALFTTLGVMLAVMVASVALIFTVGPMVSADDYDDYEPTIFKITADYFEVENAEISVINITSGMSADFYEIVVPNGVRVLRGSAGESGEYNFVSTKCFGDFMIWYEILSVELPDSLERISYRAFSEMQYLTEIEIPDNVTYIGDCAFYRCTLLNNVKLPNNLKYIGMGAFDCCSSLTSIVIPASVTEMDNCVFDWCTNLTTIYCEAASQPDGWLPNWKGNNNAEVVWGYNAGNNQNNNENQNDNNENQQNPENIQIPTETTTVTDNINNQTNTAVVAAVAGTTGGAAGLGTIGTILGVAISKNRKK